MTSQIRRSKRAYSEIESDDDPLARSSVRVRRPTAKLAQSMLGFTRSQPGQGADAHPPSAPSTLPSLTRDASLSPELSTQPSTSRSTSRRKHTIAATKRVTFDIDIGLVGPEYRLRTRTIRSINKSRISWIYLHGIELEKKDGNGKYWLCRPCYDVGNVKIMPAASTSSCSEHLRSNLHRIYPPGVEAPASASGVSTALLDSFLEAQHPQHAERWRVDFVNWIAHDDITFEQAASPLLRKVIIGGGPTVQRLLPCSKTVRSWVLSTYKERISDVKVSLAQSRSKINISFDAWSSPNSLSLLGIVGHWIDEQRHLKTGLLALRPLESHHGSDIAAVLLPVIKTFNIEDKLGAFQMDNATNNDKALQALTTSIPSLNVKESRLRCFGHIINLVVKALLYGSGSSSLQKQLDDAGDKEAFRIWRQRGAIGHLHNLVTYIARSERRLRAFEAAQKVDASDLPLHLLKDLGVRWNSTFSMIKRALRLQPAIQRYCLKWTPADGENYDLTKDFLDAQDWEELRHFEELLQPFDRATKRVEGNAYTGSHGALWEVIPTMDFLFSKLKKHADEVTDKPALFTDHYKHCLNHGFTKLSEYYSKIDDSRLYSAAVALNPCRRFTYFDTVWRHNKGGLTAIRKAKHQTKELFEEYLTRHRVSTPPSAASLLTSPGGDEDEDEDDDWTTAFGKHSVSADDDLIRLRQQQETELARFMDATLDTSLTSIVNGQVIRSSYMNEPLRWWRDRGESLYPTLATMAYDLFAVPGMSSECERAFSAAKRLITDERYSLKSDIIEADQCVKSWFKNGIADGQAAFNSIAVVDDSTSAMFQGLDSS